MSRLPLPRALATALVPLCAAGAMLTGAPAATAAPAPVAVEGERMTRVSGKAWVSADAAAYGRAAMVLGGNSTVAATVTTPLSGQLTLRLRGDQYKGAPHAVVSVDGRQAAAFDVAATKWTDYVVRGAWAAGRHTVKVSFTNDLYGAGAGDRNLRVDRLTFSPAPPSAPAPIASDAAYAARIVTLVNNARAKAGLRPLAVSKCAEGYARSWSAHMAKAGVFAHRSDLAAVMRACSAYGIGENIAYGNVSADTMMAMWMNSPGHRANILNPRYTHIGVGVSTTASGRVYGTQNFLVASR